MKAIYLDHASATPMLPGVIDEMMPFLSSVFANPASPHSMGRESASVVQSCRARIAKRIGCLPERVVFVSGATEANAIGVRIFGENLDGGRVFCPVVEHKSMLRAVERYVPRDSVVELPVDRNGAISIDTLKDMEIGERDILILMLGNNEIGRIDDFDGVRSLKRERGFMLACDVTQAVGRYPLSVDALMADFAMFSAHKFGGPKGVGCLIVPAELDPRATRYGGQQERGLRAGTLNVPGIVGMAYALECCTDDLEGKSARLRHLRDKLEGLLVDGHSSARVNAAMSPRLPHITSITFPGRRGELVRKLADVCCSSGAACSSEDKSGSHVLSAIGIGSADAASTLRLSVGLENTDDEVETAARYILSRL